MKVRAFRGFRPREDLVHRIPSPPYDVIDSEQARRLARTDPHTFLRVLRPEIDLDPGTDPYDDRVYRKGRENFRRMTDEGWLVREGTPAFYVYRLESGDHVQTGFVAAVSVEDYLQGRIKKHELTRKDKEEDRTRHIEAIGAHTGPVLLAFPRVPDLRATVNDATSSEAAADFRASDGVRHSLWLVTDAATRARVEALFAGVQRIYIADGHHRAAAAARVAARRRGAGERPHDYFLGVLFPSDELRILDYNRIVRDLNGLEPDAFVQQVRDAGFAVAEHRARRPPRRRSFGMYLRGRWYLLTFLDAPGAGADGGPAKDLDAALLSERVLEPILGVGDIRTDRRVDFVGGSHGMDALERRVDSGDYAVALAVPPTSMDEVMKVADAGAIMPPKSTWFDPKLRSGMVVYTLDDDSLA